MTTNQTWRIYIADTDTDCLLVEASREDAISAFEGLRESCWNGWMYGPVTAELECVAQANGWVDDTPRCPEETPGLLTRLASKFGRKEV